LDFSGFGFLKTLKNLGFFGAIFQLCCICSASSGRPISLANRGGEICERMKMRWLTEHAAAPSLQKPVQK